jgi:hypothetical protein
MVRKTLIALAAVAFAGAMLPATSADARMGFRSGGGFVGARSHFAFRPAFHHRRFFVAAPFIGAGIYGASCWRWRPTPWGWQRVWVCGSY